MSLYCLAVRSHLQIRHELATCARLACSPKLMVAVMMAIVFIAACGTTAVDEAENGGTAGADADNIAGASGSGEFTATGGGSEVLAGVVGGFSVQGGGGSQAGDMPGSNNSGGVGGTNSEGGMAGTAGSTMQAGGISGIVDVTKERLWIDADLTFGPEGSITHNQPNNWFSPIDYYNGPMEVRAEVTEAPSGLYGLELCLYKSAPGDATHACLPLAYRLMGKGLMFKTHMKSSIVLRYFLSQGDLAGDSFRTPWAVNRIRLVGTEHAISIAGPVKTHLTVVLVPKGYAFSGWSKYPLK
jgi:hypothetical protein